MISKNTSLMQLISIFFTYSKSLHAGLEVVMIFHTTGGKGKAVCYGLIPVAYMYSIIFF